MDLDGQNGPIVTLQIEFPSKERADIEVSPDCLISELYDKVKTYCKKEKILDEWEVFQYKGKILQHGPISYHHLKDFSVLYCRMRVQFPKLRVKPGRTGRGSKRAAALVLKFNRRRKQVQSMEAHSKGLSEENKDGLFGVATLAAKSLARSKAKFSAENAEDDLIMANLKVPHIQKIHPTAGLMEGETRIEVMGYWPYGSDVDIKIGNSSCTEVMLLTENKIIALTPPCPPSGADLYEVTVEVDGTKGERFKDGCFFFYEGPVLVGIEPRRGPNFKATVVMIEGYNLGNEPSLIKVTLSSGQELMDVAIVEPNKKITATVPQGLIGGQTHIVQVSVTHPFIGQTYSAQTSSLCRYSVNREYESDRETSSDDSGNSEPEDVTPFPEHARWKKTTKDVKNMISIVQAFKSGSERSKSEGQPTDRSNRFAGAYMNSPARYESSTPSTAIRQLPKQPRTQRTESNTEGMENDRYPGLKVKGAPLSYSTEENVVSNNAGEVLAFVSSRMAKTAKKQQKIMLD